MQTIRVFYFFCLISILSTMTAYGQFTYPTKYHATQFTNRIVVLESDFGGEEYAKVVREKVPKYWSLPNKLELMTNAQIRELIKDDTRAANYAILSMGNRKEAGVNGTPGRMIMTAEVKNTAIYLADMARQWDRNLIDDYNTAEGSCKRGAYVFSISMLDYPRTDADFKFVMKQFHDFITYCQTDSYTYDAKYKPSKNVGQFAAIVYPERISLLKTKTLLIPEEILKTSHEKVTSIYKYPVKIMSFEEMQKTINDSSQHNYCYFLPAWNDNNSSISIFVADDEGSSIAFIPMNQRNNRTFQLFSLTLNSYFELTDESFKQLAAKIDEPIKKL
jgi:hypothetical protein